jgi:hypothetical protein
VKPDKDVVTQAERALAESWRTMKEIKEEYEEMSESELRERLSELQVDMIFEDADSIMEEMQQ